VKSVCCDHEDMVAEWYLEFCKRNDFKPVKRFQNRSAVLEFWSLDNSSSKSILDVLETIYLIFWKTIVQRVAVVKLGVYDGGGNCFGDVKVKVD